MWNPQVLQDVAKAAGKRVHPVTLTGNLAADTAALRSAAGGGAHFTFDMVGCVLRNCGLRRGEGLGISHSEIALVSIGAIKRGVMIRVLQISGDKLRLVLR